MTVKTCYSGFGQILLKAPEIGLLHQNGTGYPTVLPTWTRSPPLNNMGENQPGKPVRRPIQDEKKPHPVAQVRLISDNCVAFR